MNLLVGLYRRSPVKSVALGSSVGPSAEAFPINPES